jgi:2'-5' RNA ligase
VQQPASWRLFVAFVLPDAVKAEMEKAQAELRAAAPKDAVRWTRRDQFHLTLKFLGNVEAGQSESLKEALNRACGGFSPLRLCARGIGFFPHARSPRVVWVGLDDSLGQLAEVQAAVETAVRDFTAEEPEGRFTGHVTLGRVRALKRSQAEALSKVVDSMATRVFGEWTADHIELIRSELTSGGACYTTLAVVRGGDQK